MDGISAPQAAKLLGIPVEGVKTLEKQGLLHAIKKVGDENYYSSDDISRIKSNKGPTISEEAAQVEIERQRRVASSLSSVQKMLFVAGSGLAGYLILIVIFAILFVAYPLQTSDFLGYYYRLNSAKEEKKVLAAATGPGVAASNQTSIVADLMQPVAAVSLIAVKAVDDTKYTQIVTNPVVAAGSSGLTVIGPQGPIGLQGLAGATGLQGIQGIQGLTGAAGATGTVGTLTLGSGLSGNITDGNLTLTLSLPSVGTAGTYGSTTQVPVLTTDAQGRITGVTNTAIAGLTVSNFGSANISQWTNNSGYLTSEADTLQSVFNRGNSLPTTAGSPANTVDQATIAVGNIASTAQNNFSTLNLTNGGSGFLDVELVHGMLNMQGMNTFSDDFIGRALNTTNTWQAITTSGAGNTCSPTFITGAVNGILRFTTSGTSGRGCALTTQSTLTNGFYQRGNNPVFETKVTLSNVTNARVYAGFTNTVVPFSGNTNASTHHAYIGLRSTDTQWQCITDGGGATETFTSTGVTAIANTAYRLRVEVRNGTTPETICTVDDGTTVTRVASTATQPGLTNPMDIYIKAENGGGGSVVASWDYVRTWQDDPIAQGLTFPEATTSAEEVIDASSSGIISILQNLVEFFGKVVFHSDVAFLGRPVFNQDTAGFAFIKSGQDEALVNFDKEYISTPVVTANINLVGSINTTDVPDYAVYDLSTRGFKIKLGRATGSDLQFSWIALQASSTPPPPAVETASPSAYTATKAAETKD